MRGENDTDDQDWASPARTRKTSRRLSEKPSRAPRRLHGRACAPGCLHCLDKGTPSTTPTASPPLTASARTHPRPAATSAYTTGCRFDSSLGMLTKKFLNLIQTSDDGILDLNVAADQLQARPQAPLRPPSACCAARALLRSSPAAPPGPHPASAPRPHPLPPVLAPLPPRQRHPPAPLAASRISADRPRAPARARLI